MAKKWAYTGGASFAVYNLIPKDKLEFGLSPVMLAKARKNDVRVLDIILRLIGHCHWIGIRII